MIERDLMILTALMFITISMLVYVGEVKYDAYLAVAILIYFIYTSVNYSFRSRVNLKVVDIAFIALFIGIVSYRVYEILR
ncbi:MAG: hypothetical protein N3G48_07330 [Sulfolobales archaeon]|nr:hypothetical protein [Sulfolobales archaeon]